MGQQNLYKGRNWAELLSPQEAEVAAYYQTGIYDEKPAVTINNYGDGTAIYIGTFPNSEFYVTLVDWLIRKKKIESVLPSITGLEATKRSSSNSEVIFALNYNNKAIQIPCNGREFQDIISGERIKDLLKIEGRDARILKIL